MVFGQIPDVANRPAEKGEERRINRRRNVSLRVDYTDQTGRAWLGLARNISIGGMFLEYTPELSVGDTITTAFVLPSGRPYRLKAQVVHCNPTGAGISFEQHQMNTLSTKMEYLERFCAA